MAFEQNRTQNYSNGAGWWLLYIVCTVLGWDGDSVAKYIRDGMGGWLIDRG